MPTPPKTSPRPRNRFRSDRSRSYRRPPPTLPRTSPRDPNHETPAPPHQPAEPEPVGAVIHEFVRRVPEPDALQWAAEVQAALTQPAELGDPGAAGAGVRRGGRARPGLRRPGGAQRSGRPRRARGDHPPALRAARSAAHGRAPAPRQPQTARGARVRRRAVARRATGPVDAKGRVRRPGPQAPRSYTARLPCAAQ